ncbi:MAG: ABC transporter ATP-binding protein [Chloroflexota bacterium]|nr:ABC transporter ATP-binding protein [Chloroflexota bacterium]MDE2908324.1 ABC transporter ATP-binding protein [Chloroflexota bacterium]
MTNQSSSNARPRFIGGHGGGRPTGEKAKDRRGTLRRLSDYLKPYHGRLLLVSLLVVLATILGLVGPALLGRAIDQYVVHHDIDGLLAIVLLMAAVYLAQGLFTAIHGIIMTRVGQHFVADIRAALFRHFQALSMDYHDRHRTGDLMSRISNDSETINQILSNGLIQFTTNVLSLGGIMVAMLLLNLPLAIGTLIILPIMLWITRQVTERTRVAFRGMQRNLGTLNAVMEENITGIRAVQAYAQEKAAIAQFQAASEDYRKVGIRADFITAALGPMFTTMMILTVAATALLGGWLALQDLVSVGVLATFVVYIMNFFRPMRGIAMVFNQLQSALAGAERIFAVLDAAPTVTDEPGARPLQNIRGAVSFERVSFAYEPGNMVLEDISLDAAPGATIALVGPTGAGKTTIISLLSRFYDVSRGSISIDGVDIRAVTQNSIREQLGIVLQDTFLFSGTVMENIRYGRLEATDAEVIEAAKLANADDFIHLLPRGYQTQVSEKGHNFSQGQRQLLAIARAILADPRILILDEATSSVDTRTEIHIQEALLHLLDGRTAFVIAHRLSTIRNADLVLVVNDQRIIERGTHDELLAAGGFYHQLYMSQYHRLGELVAVK